MTEALLDAGPLAQAAAIREGKTTSEALVAGHLARIAALDPQIHAFVEVFHKTALRDARAADRGPARGRFHGVPIGIKDMNLVRFRRTRFGSRAALPFWAPMDDRSVATLRAAGFVLIGKLATSELGAMPVTEPEGQPPARNPWNLERSPGGSSGGSAAAVAAGLVPVAHGSDGGGSIRIPAACCGLVGLKASRGRIPNAFGMPEEDLLYTCGALVRRVADAAALFEVMSGTSVQREEPGPLRLRLILEGRLAPTDPAVAAATEAVAARLAAAGHRVERGQAPDGDIDDFLPLWQSLIASFPLLRFEKAQAVTRWLAAEGRRQPKGFARARQRELAARWTAWSDEVDVVLTPTMPIPPPAVGAYDHGDGEAAFRAAAVMGSFTAPFNVTGQPAISVPVGLHPELGTPIGVQLAAAQGQEARLLGLAAWLEREIGFDARPALHTTGR